jgi:hypothetical protein
VDASVFVNAFNPHEAGQAVDCQTPEEALDASRR